MQTSHLDLIELSDDALDLVSGGLMPSHGPTGSITFGSTSFFSLATGSGAQAAANQNGAWAVAGQNGVALAAASVQGPVTVYF